MKIMFLLNQTQSESHENAKLKQEHNGIGAENKMFKGVMRNPLCTTCGSLEVMDRCIKDNPNNQT